MKTLQEKKHELLNFFDKPKKWTQYASARDKDGLPTVCNSKNAVSFCLLGALTVIEDYHYENRFSLYYTLKNYLEENIHEWNDAPERTFEDIQIMLKGFVETE
jgi:hypothetical protein